MLPLVTRCHHSSPQDSSTSKLRFPMGLKLRKPTQATRASVSSLLLTVVNVALSPVSVLFCISLSFGHGMRSPRRTCIFLFFSVSFSFASLMSLSLSLLSLSLLESICLLKLSSSLLFLSSRSLSPSPLSRLLSLSPSPFPLPLSSLPLFLSSSLPLFLSSSVPLSLSVSQCACPSHKGSGSTFTVARVLVGPHVNGPGSQPTDTQNHTFRIVRALMSPWHCCHRMCVETGLSLGSHMQQDMGIFQAPPHPGAPFPFA